MKRFWSTLQQDITIQFRNGFYYVSLFFIVVWVSILALFPDDGRFNFSLIVPTFVVLNLLITTFYFIGGLVLLEKSEGALTALVVSPLRDSEYLAAKILSLTLLGVVESLLIMVLAYGIHFRTLPLLVGMGLLGTIYTLFGFVSVIRYDAINEYILPSGVIVVFLMLPLLGYLGLWSTVLFYLHPIQPALLLMRSAFTPLDNGEWLYSLVGSLLWVSVLFYWARQTFERFVMRTVGR